MLRELPPRSVGWLSECGMAILSSSVVWLSCHRVWYGYPVIDAHASILDVHVLLESMNVRRNLLASILIFRQNAVSYLFEDRVLGRQAGH